MSISSGKYRIEDELGSMSFIATRIRKKLNLPEPTNTKDWSGVDFMRYELLTIERHFNGL